MLNERGLTQTEAEKRLKEFGYNEIRDISRTTPLGILLRQIRGNFVVYLLFAAMLISFFVGKSITAYVILGVILTVVSLGFVQEYRSENAISALKGMIVPVSVVVREGKEKDVLSREIVPGDILILRSGEKIPADCIILREKELRVNESVLTGESKEIKKLVGDEAKCSEVNMVFAGTYIVNGKCVAKVLHTGMNTKFGKIAGMISTAEKALPLQEKVNKIAKYLAIIGVVISLITGAIMISRASVIDADVAVNVLILVIALSVAAFPESFPVVLITALSSGAYRMAKLNAIVNRMSIIETLGETTVICSDKTGTITRGEMTVKRVFDGASFFEVSGAGYDEKGHFTQGRRKVDVKKNSHFIKMLKTAVLCNDARIERTGEGDELKVSGSPTEAALLVMAAKGGVFREDLKSERVEELPFSSERKMMSVLCVKNKEKRVYSKGAPEYILRKCGFVQKAGRVAKLSEKEKKKILEANSSMTSACLRTIALAYKATRTSSQKELEKNLVFLGLVGMEDPPRDEVKESISKCRAAGIEVKMITGDNKETALAVAKEIGLSGRLMEGSEIENATDEELAKLIPSISIFSRVKPEHKLRIVRALKANGEVVTMTGDGVNDAPALKEAHIGVAMGRNGTDVSRSVADLTLKDDHFSTIVTAISEGRTIFKNIRKFVTYQLSCNFAELGIIFIGVLLAPFLGWQIPLLLALQILFMNLVTADFPAITLAINPSSQDIMEEKPRKNAEILNKKLIALLFFNGTLMTLFVLMTYFISYNVIGKSVEHSRTIALFTLILFEIVSAFNFRSFRKGVFGRSLFVNPYLVYGSLLALFFTFLILYTPLNKIFETVPLDFEALILASSFALLMVAIFDVLKILNRRKKVFDFDHS